MTENKLMGTRVPGSVGGAGASIAPTEKRPLMKSHSALVFQAVKDAGFDPSEFKWEECVSAWEDAMIPRLVHIQSDFYFEFDRHKEGVRVSRRSPGHELEKDATGGSDWATQYKFFTEWLQYLRREVEAPDPWSSISDGRVIADQASSDTDNSPFTQPEKEYIVGGLEEVKEFLVTSHQLTGERLAFIELRLGYLVEASDRVGRKDWKNLFLAVLFSIILYLSLPQSAAGELFRLSKAALYKIFGGEHFLP